MAETQLDERAVDNAFATATEIGIFKKWKKY